MKLITLILNIIGLIVAFLWLKKSNFDYEPILTIIGFIGTLIATVFTNKREQTVKDQRELNSTSIKFPIIYLIILIGLLLFSIYSLNAVSIVGIKGNNNDNNMIQLK